MTEYKMLCLDIDGTLLNSTYKITPKTKVAIRMAIEQKNIMIVLASARMPSGMFFLLDEMGIEAPLVSYNGAMIYDEHRTLISNEEIPVDCVVKLYQQLKSTGMKFNYYQGNKWFIEQEDDWTSEESANTGTIPELITYNELYCRWSETKSGPNKILLMGDAFNVIEADRLMHKLNMEQILSFPSKPTYYEIISSRVSKTKAIQILQSRYGIATEHVIAVGDNYNDVDMLNHAGLGVAMGNAPEEVKRQVKLVTYTNDQDGVASVIEKYIMSQL